MVVMRSLPEINITTSHSYEIHYKQPRSESSPACSWPTWTRGDTVRISPRRYRYQCESCGNGFGRQSKSVDLLKQRCAQCGGGIVLLGAFNRDGEALKSREPTAFARFVQARLSQPHPPSTRRARVTSPRLGCRRTWARSGRSSRAGATAS
jgi:hypothetical protein